MILYPYYLYKQESEEGATQDYEGNFTSTPSSWILHSRCRDEANGVNGPGRSVPLPNGDNYIYAAVIYTPHSSEIIPEGTNTIVSKYKLDPGVLQDEANIKSLRQSGLIRSNGIIKGFEQSRLNIRLWL